MCGSSKRPRVEEGDGGNSTEVAVHGVVLGRQEYKATVSGVVAAVVRRRQGVATVQRRMV